MIHNVVLLLLLLLQLLLSPLINVDGRGIVFAFIGDEMEIILGHSELQDGAPVADEQLLGVSATELGHFRHVLHGSDDLLQPVADARRHRQQVFLGQHDSGQPVGGSGRMRSVVAGYGKRRRYRR